MPLDIVLLGADGHPEMEVQLDIREHTCLIALAQQLNLPLLQRLKDYYEDAEFSFSEMGALASEVECLVAGDVESETVQPMLRKLLSLVKRASERSQGLEALAD